MTRDLCEGIKRPTLRPDVEILEQVTIVSEHDDTLVPNDGDGDVRILGYIDRSVERDVFVRRPQDLSLQQSAPSNGTVITQWHLAG